LFFNLLRFFASQID